MADLIGLYSPAPQSGKTTLANALVTAHGYHRVAFADPLKAMTCRFLESLGYRQDEAERLVHVDKAATIPALGVTARHLLQTLGTEWGRSCVAPDVWLKCWAATAVAHPKVVADDVRFWNEAELIRSLGGEVWLIIRPGKTDTSGHPSEGGLDGWEFDRVIHNDGTAEEMLHALG